MEIKQKFVPDHRLGLMDQVRQVLRYYHYAYRTEQTYCDWIVRFIRYHQAAKHPREMGKPEIESFLSDLAAREKVSASTQRQALNALVFLYRNVLLQPVEGEIAPVRARRYRKVPVVMTQAEVKKVMEAMSGTHLLMAKLLYGSGLRLMECVRLRVQNLDFERNLIHVQDAKGDRGRSTLLPKSLHAEMRRHLEKVKNLHEEDTCNGFGDVYLPEALAKKYRGASREFRWQYVFPSKHLSADPRSGVTRRHHVLESGLQKAVKAAVDRAGILQRATCHTFRHCFATHLLENGVNIRAVQELMGHADVKTTEIYTHVMQRDLQAVASPLDSIMKP